MTTSETTLDEWSEVEKMKPVGFGLYTKLFIIVAAYFIFPVMAAYSLNAWGEKEWNWVLMGLMAFLDYFILFYPYAWLAVAGAGFAAGQPGGTKGWSNEEGIKKVKEWVPGVYRFAVRTIIGKQAVFILLALLPVAGNQATTAIILGNVLIVILGSSMADDGWKHHPFTRTVYLACCLLLTLAVAYWAAVSVVPDLRPFKAKAITTEVEEEIRRQHETTIKLALEGAGPIKGIARKLKEMPHHLTLEERLEIRCPTPKEREAWENSSDLALKERLMLPCITPEERRVWEAAQSNIAERALHGLKEQAGKIDKKVRGWSKDGSPATAAGSINNSTESASLYQKKWSGKFVPSQGELTLGSFDGGRYRVTGSGWRTQVIYKIVDGDPVIEGEYAINKDGVYHNGSTGRGSSLIPFPDRAFGAIIVKVNGKPEWAASESCFSVPPGATLILSLNTKDDQRHRAGSGGFDLRVEKC